MSILKHFCCFISVQRGMQITAVYSSIIYVVYICFIAAHFICSGELAASFEYQVVTYSSLCLLVLSITMSLILLGAICKKLPIVVIPWTMVIFATHIVIFIYCTIIIGRPGNSFEHLIETLIIVVHSVNFFVTIYLVVTSVSYIQENFEASVEILRRQDVYIKQLKRQCQITLPGVSPPPYEAPPPYDYETIPQDTGSPNERYVIDTQCRL